jgi:hypothetical protein
MHHQPLDVYIGQRERHLEHRDDLGVMWRRRQRPHFDAQHLLLPPRPILLPLLLLLLLLLRIVPPAPKRV